MTLTSESHNVFELGRFEETRYLKYIEGTNFFGENTLPCLQAVVFNMTMFQPNNDGMFTLHIPGPEEPQHTVTVIAKNQEKFSFVQMIDPETRAVKAIDVYAGGALQHSSTIKADRQAEGVLISMFISWARENHIPEDSAEFEDLFKDTELYLRETIREEAALGTYDTRGIPAFSLGGATWK